MRTLAVALAVLLSACTSGDSSPATCQEISDQFDVAAESLDDSCETVADCTVIGGQINDWSCNCVPTLQSHGVTRAAYTGSEAADLSVRFRAECDSASAPIVCDAAPPEVSCVNQRCVIDAPSCLDDVDAGV